MDNGISSKTFQNYLRVVTPTKPKHSEVLFSQNDKAEQMTFSSQDFKISSKTEPPANDYQIEMKASNFRKAARPTVLHLTKVKLEEKAELYDIISCDLNGARTKIVLCKSGGSSMPIESKIKLEGYFYSLDKDTLLHIKL